MSTCEQNIGVGGCHKPFMLEYSVIREGGRIIEEHPYMRFGGSSDGETFYLQHGEFWDAEGHQLTPGAGRVPSAESLYAQFNHVALRDCGLADPEE